VSTELEHERLVTAESNFADPYRDPRTPCGRAPAHIHPDTAQALGIADGDYVYVDANPLDRPYIGWKPDDPFYKVARLMLRAKYNPAYPRGIVMMKHGPFQATERSVKAHETRPDGRALSEGTGYQANLRYGSQQSVTRDWSMPMHQTDNLFHKAKDATVIFGYEKTTTPQHGPRGPGQGYEGRTRRPAARAVPGTGMSPGANGSDAALPRRRSRPRSKDDRQAPGLGGSSRRGTPGCVRGRVEGGRARRPARARRCPRAGG
jgi:hypothetical protein